MVWAAMLEKVARVLLVAQVVVAAAERTLAVLVGPAVRRAPMLQPPSLA
jgi:hypothetical protein